MHSGPPARVVWLARHRGTAHTELWKHTELVEVRSGAGRPRCRTPDALKGCPVAETKSTQTGSGSSPARAGGLKNREQSRRGTTVGAGNGGRSRTGSPVTTGANPPRQPLPLAGAGGRRGRGNPINFVRDVRLELRKVAWPTRRETMNLTAVVIALSVAVGLFLGGTDFVFQELFRFLLGIQSSGGV